jgi:4-amino-4-deoxy-L-arabinose transferase-like glycosyltransferase
MPWCILVGYGLLHVVIRVLISETAELDEAEQLLLTQSLALGYGAQPPLYTWLQMLFFTVVGVNILALTLLKNLLLLATQLCLFLAARLILRDNALALLASLSLWLMPQIAWESHRDLTHSVLVTSISSGMFYVMLKLLHTGSTGYYLLLGLLLGLGILAKHNFVLFVAPLGIAVMSLKGLRAHLLDWRLGLTVALAGALVCPYVLWLFDHMPLMFGHAAAKLAGQTPPPSLRGTAVNLFRVLSAAVRFVIPLVPIYVVLFPKLLTAPSSRMPDRQLYGCLLERFFLAGMALLVAATLLFGVSFAKDRWLQPLLFLTPLYLCLRLQDIPVQPGRFKALTCIIGVFGLVFLVTPLAQIWGGPWFGVYSRLHVPFAEIADDLRAAGFRQGTILTDNTFIGGNLRLVFTASRVLTPAMLDWHLAPPPVAGPCLAIWNTRDHRDVPVALQRLAEAHSGIPFPGAHTPQYLAARLPASEQETLRLGFLFVSGSTGQCR